MLRLILRQLGDVPLWGCAMAALTLALSSVVPFIERSTAVNQQAILGGYCFAMAGLWLALSAVVKRRASMTRLALMSLCFGLAAGSRPPLGLTALVLIPVYASLRSSYPTRRLSVALLAPVGVCLALLLAYNQARFHEPLEFGTKHQLAGYDSRIASISAVSYIRPGLWYYLFSPPRPTALFPFLRLGPPPLSYPASLPEGYLKPEPTSGLLVMAPILIFIIALPWLWRRRAGALGPLAPPLLLMAGAGIGGLVFASYEFFATTERYEVDFATLFLICALAAWLALVSGARGHRRRLLLWGGTLLAAWACLTGLLASFTGASQQFPVDHPGTWRALEDFGSPVSAGIAALAGKPILAEVTATNVLQETSPDYESLSSGAITGFWLGERERATLTVVSPDTRRGTFLAGVASGPKVASGASLEARVTGPEAETSSYPVPAGEGKVEIPVKFHAGVNRFTLTAHASAVNPSNSANPISQALLGVMNLSLVSG
jgi:hypothetical protein